MKLEVTLVPEGYECSNTIIVEGTASDIMLLKIVLDKSKEVTFTKVTHNNGIREYCHAQKDGDCNWTDCPQLKDRQPHCILDIY